MMLIGKGEGQTAQGYDEKPQWQDNLLIAQRLTDGLNSQVSGLGKDVRIKSGRFNQHIAVGCLVVEVGNNQNTLEEALAAMPYLADAVYQELRRVEE
jgi:stage II sporulation protein P